ncbi:hypothetical protein ABTK82_20725, partial [Acinetobacter baumannii]
NSTVLNYSGFLFPVERQFAIDADGGRIKPLTADTGTDTLAVPLFGGAVIDWDLPGRPGRVLMMRYFVPKQSIGSNIT